MTVLDKCLSTPAMNSQMAIDTVATLPSGRRLAECNHESRWRKKREAVHNVFMHAPDDGRSIDFIKSNVLPVIQ